VITVVGLLAVEGTAAAPVLFTRAPGAGAHEYWGGIVAAPGAEVRLAHAVLMFAGGTKHRVGGTGSHIKDACPALTASPGSGTTLTLAHTAVVHSRGPGIGAGLHSVVSVSASYFNDVAQGGECVGCAVTLRDSHFVNMLLRPPAQRRRFVDKDNDGFYFRGGTAAVERCVIMNVLDDCVDTASSKDDAEHSTLTITDSVLANCQHEGVALSASVGTRRTVAVRRTLVKWAQQAVEVGYTPATHRAALDECVFEDCAVGVRYGDNYRLAVRGALAVTRSHFSRNAVDALDFVKQERAKTRVARLGPAADGGADGGGERERVSIAKSVFWRQCPAAGAGAAPASSSDGARGAFCGELQFRSEANEERCAAAAAAADGGGRAAA
jgi:hypothetical protein